MEQSPSWEANSHWVSQEMPLEPEGSLSYSQDLAASPYTEPDTSIISVGFWQWCVSIERIVLLDFSHRLVSQKTNKTKLRN
jgi:hypothetical protein